MHYVSRLAQLSFAALLGIGSLAHAQETSETTPPAEATSSAPATETTSAEPSAPPAAENTPGMTSMESAPPAPGETMTEDTTVAAAAAKPVDAGHFGVAARWRYVSVPGWFLGLFAQKNVPLSSWKCFAMEGYWRKRDKDDPKRTWEIAVSAGYQDMSPPDGFWLGRGKELTQDTDLVQTKGLGLITFDAAYVLRQYFSPYFGIHYGAGLGLGIVQGKILRTSATCNEATGRCEVVIPGVCGGGNPPCNEADLKQSELNPPDNGPGDPHRYQETSVPSAIPIINLLFGLDFPIPDAQGLEFRLEGGFYNAFFVGASGGYLF